MSNIGIVSQLAPLFYPKSLAVFGASQDEEKFGSRFLRALQLYGYPGPIYPVHPHAKEIFGLKAYAHATDLPEIPDLACLSVPAKYVIRVLEDCLKKKIPMAIIFTSGFKETGLEEDKKLEEEIMERGKRGIRIVGPNCFGVYCPEGGLTLLPGQEFVKESGPVGFISQSGGFAKEFSCEAPCWGINFSKVVSYGNACDLNELDFLSYLSQDPKTEIITFYLEGVKKGREFLNLVKETVRRKPVIIWKSGLTSIGARTVLSHTGSMGGEEAIWQAFFRQTGAIQVRSMTEMMDTVQALHFLKGLNKKRLVIIGGGGGMSAAAADMCDRLGLELPVLEATTQAKLKGVAQPAGISLRNPVDVGSPLIPPGALSQLLEITGDDGRVDLQILIQMAYYIFYQGQGAIRQMDLKAPESIPAELKATVNYREKTGRPLVVITPPMDTRADLYEIEKGCRLARDYYLRGGIPVYPTLDRALTAISHAVRYHRFLEEKMKMDKD